MTNYVHVINIIAFLPELDWTRRYVYINAIVLKIFQTYIYMMQSDEILQF